LILYVNGDSHTAGAEAVNTYSFARDDSLYWNMDREPHPDNLRVSYGCELANMLGAILQCDAESASSNARIIRTTRTWLAKRADAVHDILVIIQWSTWEREEWLHNGIYYQIGASGTDHVPAELTERYKNFVADVDWQHKTQQAHDEIWQFHNELKLNQIQHVMFNGNSHFGKISQTCDWSQCYMAPYDPDQTYDSVLRNNRFKTVNPDSWHFGQSAHCFWADHVLQYIYDNNLIVANEIRTD
jgi:hypothetical protein